MSNSVVLASIELFHLNYYMWVEKRKEIWNSCKNRIDHINLVYGKENKTDGESRFIAQYIIELMKMIKKDSEFSATAIDCICYYKNLSGYNWLSNFFPENVLEK